MAVDGTKSATGTSSRHILVQNPERTLHETKVKKVIVIVKHGYFTTWWEIIT
jgi:hypothetical protein